MFESHARKSSIRKKGGSCFQFEKKKLSDDIFRFVFTEAFFLAIQINLKDYNNQYAIGMKHACNS